MKLSLAVLPILFCQKLLAAPSSYQHRIFTRSYSKDSVEKTECDGKRYVYEGLGGYGFIPSNAKDKYGDTLGGFGSSIALDQSSWQKLKNGTYTGILYALPDRGW